MKIVFVVYHDLLTEARSQDTLKALEEIGEVIVISQKELPAWSKSKGISVPHDNQKKGFRYARFLYRAKKVIKEEKPDIVFLHDAFLLIPFVKRHCSNSRIVCDQSELMVDRKNSNIRLIVLNILDFFYKHQMKKADLVFCANEERAIITQFYFGLKDKPLVFENIHRIDDDYDENLLKKKYSRYLPNESGSNLIVYGGGISKARKTYDLMRALTTVDNVKLIVAGACPEGENSFNRLIDELHLSERVTYIGFVPRCEWRFLLSIADISFIAFERNCWNNIYCASGKAFESLFEGTPVLCSANPPLQRLCKEKHVGIATDDFSYGIKELLSDLDVYKKKAYEYSLELDYESRIQELINNIEGII